MAINDDTVFTSKTSDFPMPSKLVALNVKTGRERWTYQFDDADLGVGEIFIHDNGIYIWTWRRAEGEPDNQPRGTILCLDLITGKLNWRLKCNDWIGNTFVVDSGMLYYMVFRLHEMDMPSFKSVETKRLVPKWTSSYFNNPSRPVISGNIMIVADGNRLIALAANTAKDLWNVALGKKEIVSAPVVIHGTVYVVDREGQLFAIDTVNGSLKWVIKIIGESVDWHCVYMIGTDDGILYCADHLTGHLFSINTK
jgi:outer membrane protein assembly factor BamB